MKIETLPLTAITPYARNPRRNQGSSHRRGEKIKRTCEVCGKCFDVYLSNLRCSNSTGRFCSKDCYTAFKRTLTGEKHNRYCKNILHCRSCGKQILVIKSKIAMYSDHYCSNACRHNGHIGMFAGTNNPNWRGGHVSRKGNFSTIKSLNFSGVNFCAFCGTSKRINIHHIIPFRYTQDNSLDNLIPVCVSCHRKIEIDTWNLLDSAEWNDLNQVKDILNIIFREIQFNTYHKLKKLYNHRSIIESIS